MSARIGGSGWAGTGRVVEFQMTGLSQRELRGNLSLPPLLERLAARSELATPAELPSVREYVERALVGGFPAAIGLPTPQRHRWLDAYIHQLVARDAQQAGAPDPRRLGAFFAAYAAASAATPALQALAETAGIAHATASAYVELLRRLYVVDELPAWRSTRLARVAAAPKRYLVDPSLQAAAFGLDVDGALRDADALGRILDTFVVAQLRADLDVLPPPRPRLYHLRADRGRREVDLVVELAGGRVVGLEVKAGRVPTTEDARHLAWLRDALGERFVIGLVLHAGSHVVSLGDRLVAAPISTLWS